MSFMQRQDFLLALYGEAPGGKEMRIRESRKDRCAMNVEITARKHPWYLLVRVYDHIITDKHWGLDVRLWACSTIALLQQRMLAEGEQHEQNRA
jgi:hypothetical protein